MPRTPPHALLLAPLLLAGPVLADPAPKAPRSEAPPAIACASLANYRILMRQARDAVAAAAVLADPKADHLGCARLERDGVTGRADHVVLDGRSYDCLSLRSTSICQWTASGSVALPPEKPGRAAEPAKETGKAKR